MDDLKKRRFNNAVWIPLYACQELEKSGRVGYSGYKSDFFGCGTLAIPIAERDKANKLGWDNVGIGYMSDPYIDDEGMYVPSDIYNDYENNFIGLRLVLSQSTEDPNGSDLLLHQDFILALRLKRENDTWLCPSEGYIEVVRMKRDVDGTPNLIEVRAEYLKDYLCGRKMALRMASYRERVLITKKAPEFALETDSTNNCINDERWEGYIHEIHEGGEPYGAKMAVLHVARKDVDSSEDVPVMGAPTDENVESTFYERGFSGEKCYRISGELWKNEWIEPADYSPRIANEKIPATIYFIVDSNGNRENKDTLIKDGRWLWFNPSIVTDIMALRGGNLLWHTAHTGSVSFLHRSVHFGVNPLGLVNVYAKDIALLPNWLQQIWAGRNVSPDGKVSPELLASQVNATPPETQAPEDFIIKGIEILNKLSGFQIIRETESLYKISKQCHRFRAVNIDGLYALAKDLARITADSIDATKLQDIVAAPKGEKWGSLKSLENYLGTIIPQEKAKLIMGPLFGIYDLRLADAHLPKDDYKAQFRLLSIDVDQPFVWQGYQMIDSCVSAIFRIIKAIELRNDVNKGK